jgi:hypothetical protein
VHLHGGTNVRADSSLTHMAVGAGLAAGVNITTQKLRLRACAVGDTQFPVSALSLY